MLSPVILPDVGTSQDSLSNDPSGPMATLQLRDRPPTVNRNENLLSLMVSPLNRLWPVTGKHCVDCPTHFPSNETLAGFACDQATVAASITGHATRIEIVCFMLLALYRRCSLGHSSIRACGR
jgi:hypothetical protein